MKIIQVDSFTDRPFSGNPAGVCVLEKPADETWMQNVAREMNISETAFLDPTSDGYNLRWFTPLKEVNLCGHATLASAHVLWSEGYEQKDKALRFFTKGGELGACLSDGIIELDFPSTPPEKQEAPDGLAEALGATIEWFGKTEYDYFVEFSSEDTLRALKPNSSALIKFDSRGFVVTSRSADPSFNFVSRYFAPSFGIDEDPVTGSAHCALGPYWSKKLKRNSLRGYQASARGGVVLVTTKGERVTLGGTAVIVLRAELFC